MPIVEPKSAEPPLILVIDVGSSSTRVMLFDGLGREVAGCGVRQRHALHTAPDGGVEDDVEAALRRVAACIDAVLVAAGTLVTRIGAVALDTYVSNVLGIAADGRPLTPIYTYADTRNTADAEALRAQLDEMAILERTGCPLRTSYLPARLRWLQRTQPDIVRAVRRWISLGEYVLLRYFGHTHVSLSVAAWSGLLNRHTLDWDEALLHELGLASGMLSSLVDADVPAVGLKSAYAQRWPALAQIPWFPAIGDGAAANVGSGCLTPVHIALTIGTTGALRLVAPAVNQIPWGLWCYRVDRRRALLGGATSEGGNMFAWLRTILQLGDPAAVERALMASAPDSHRLTVLPFLAGERSPGWAGAARASIIGLSSSTTATDILRAALEAVSYRFALIARLLDTALPGAQAFVASGGALLNSPAWLQLLADVLGQPIYASSDSEATSRGTALLALESLGLLTNLESLPIEHAQVYAPNMAHHARYAEAIARQQQLYAKLVEEA